MKLKSRSLLQAVTTKHRASRLDHIVAVDGEGITDEEGTAQRYTLLASSEGTCVKSHDLPTSLCFDYLLTLPTRALIVGYSINYDVNMWLKDVDEPHLRELWENGSTTWRGYRITWHPGKMFSVGAKRRRQAYQRHDGTVGYRYVYERHTTVWDVFGFFQSSFIVALENWKVGTEEQRARIRMMKEQRSFFDEAASKEIEAYCFDECALLVQMIGRLIETSERVGLKLTRYDGAGAIAASMMRKHGVKDYIGEPPPEVEQAALHGYFGGRFENAIIGTIKEGWLADINSAYPAETLELPCLVHGEWKVSNDQSPLSILHVRWNCERQLPRFGPFPYRSADGSICYPLSGEGWYWGKEVQAAKRLYPRQVHILSGFRFVPSCNHKPFAFIHEYYMQRRLMKGDFGQIILKLGLNSLYGKCAQSVGGKVIGKTEDGKFIHARPTYQSFVWAGMITSGTRARILDMIRIENVVSIATDGVVIDRSVVSVPHIGDSIELGHWSLKPIRDCSLMQNGLYRYSYQDTVVTRARGFPQRQLQWETLLDSFALTRERTVIESTVTRFLGLGVSLHRQPRLLYWRCWMTMQKKISLMPVNRLLGVEIGLHEKRQLSRDVVTTYPWHGLLGSSISFPYTPKTVFASIAHPDREQSLVDVDHDL